MRYDLARMVKASRTTRRKSIVIRPINPPAVLADDLYRSTYAKIIARLTAAVPQIVAAYERALPVRDGFADSADDVARFLDSLGDELARLVLEIVPDLKDWAVRVEGWHRNQFRGAILSATGVDIGTILMASGTPQSVGTAIAWNVALVKDVSQQAQQRMSSAVFAAFNARLPARDLAASLREIVGMSRKRSTFIAADQLNKISSALDRERQADAGITRFRWRHSGKLHPRVWHQKRNNKVYDSETLKEVDGPDQIPADDQCGMAPWCACRAAAVLVLD